MNNKKNIFLLCFFVCLVFGMAFLNLKNNALILKDYLCNQNFSAEESTKIETKINENMKLKNEWINVYGLSQLFLGKDVVGNFEYIKDNKGFMHMYEVPLDTSDFISGLKWLQEVTSSKDIPLLYVQIPDRVIDGFSEKSWAVDETSTEYAINEMVDAALTAGIDVLDLRNDIKNGKFPYEKFFFRTDIHLTTEAELYVLSQIVRSLEIQGCSLKTDILDKDNYTLVKNDFLGNLGRMSGEYFTVTDTFERYYPNFETQYTRTHLVTGEQFSGEFKNVVMNSYPEEGEKTTYWVTDYMQFTNSFYNFENHLCENEKNILVIMDSFGFRTAAYMSLLVENLTVVDTRYQGNANMAKRALDMYEYDAVVVLHSSSLAKASFMPEEILNPTSEIVSENTPRVISREKGYTIQVKVKNTGDEVWNEKRQVRLAILVNGIDYGYRSYIENGVEVSPGECYTFSISNFQATPDSYVQIDYQMVQEGVRYFGEKESIHININDGQYALDAEVISNTTPQVINRSQKYSIEIYMKNISEISWSNENDISLCIWQDGIDWGYRIALPEDVEVLPGEEYTFVLNDFQAPMGSSNTFIEYQMVQGERGYFGEKEYIPVVVENELNMQADILSVEYFQNQGQNYIKATVKNTSNFIWDENHRIRLGIWDGQVTDTGWRAYIEDGECIEPNQVYTFIQELQWTQEEMKELKIQMAYDGLDWFGESVSITK